MRTKKGLVTSAKMQKTVTVTVTRSVLHPIYKKRFPVSKKFLADTGEHDVHEGDTVRIGECSPLSKRKHFRVVEILTRGLAKEESLEVELAAAREATSGRSQEEVSTGQSAKNSSAA